MIELKNIGLESFFSACEEGSLKYINRNFFILDSVVQLNAIDFTNELPSDPSLGDIYLFNDEGYLGGAFIAAYDGRAWQFVTPKAGFIAFVHSDGHHYWFNGTDWVLGSLEVSDVSGPNGARDNSIARFDGVTGKWITDSGVILDDDDVISGLTAIYGEAAFFDSVYSDLVLSEIVDADIGNFTSIYSDELNSTYIESSRAGVKDLVFNRIFGINHVVSEAPAKSVHLLGVFNTILTPIAEIDTLLIPDGLPYSSIYSLENKSGSQVVIKNNSLIITGSGGDLALDNGQTLLLVYSSESETFNVIFGGGSGGGGGAGALKWVSDPGNEPLRAIEFGLEPYIFGSGFGQKVSSGYLVKTGHKAGKPLFLKVSNYCKELTTDNRVIRLVSTLIKAGGYLSDTTDQHTSEITLSSGTINRPDVTTHEVTDSAGQINGLDVEPGDTLLFSITRPADGSNEFLGDFYLPTELIEGPL